MKIKKTFQGTVPENKILNTESSSETDTYSCKYINEKFMKKEEGEVYSTEEVRIGTWIDGKPLYRKVIEVAVSSTTQSISLNFSIDKLKSLNGGLNNGNQIIPFGYKDDSNYCSAFIQKNSNSLYYMSSWSSGTLYITLEYTKTTD